MADLVKWYGSKEKAMEAILKPTGKADNFKPEQDENDKIYKQFMSAKKENNDQLAKEAVVMLAENYKKRFHLDNARNILLDLAKEYLAHEKLAEATDKQYGVGLSLIHICIVTTHRPTVLSVCRRVYGIREQRCVVLTAEEVQKMMDEF